MNRLSLVSVFGSLLMVSSSAWGGPVLDQYQEHGLSSMVATGDDEMLAQTFTAGLSGLLDHVEVGAPGIVAPVPPRVVEIRNTVAGQPGTTILGSVTVASFGYGWNSIDFLSQNIGLTAGQVYAIVLDRIVSHDWLYTSVKWDPSSYGPGALWIYSQGGWQIVTVSGGGDMQFRTYVETGPVIPAPGAILLGIFGAGVVGWLRRRRTL